MNQILKRIVKWCRNRKFWPRKNIYYIIPLKTLSSNELEKPITFDMKLDLTASGCFGTERGIGHDYDWVA